MSCERPDWWYENEDAYEKEYCCEECSEKENVLSEISIEFSKIVKQLYSKDDLDHAHLEKSLDEICGLLQIKIHPGNLEIERKGKKEEIRMKAALQAWQSFANSKINTA